MTCHALHHDERNWRDEPAKNGRIRTMCKHCGTFIGYRDAATDKQEKTIGSKKR